MDMADPVTGAEAGLSGDDQIRIALRAIVTNGGTCDMPTIYGAVEQKLDGRKLSEQGKATLRKLVNTIAVQAGYIYPHDRNMPGWRITPEGRDAVLTAEPQAETVLNVDTQTTEVRASNTARGAAFEQYILKLVRVLYPHYAWYYQGQHKSRERGLDLIGSQIGESNHERQSIGAQVKFHASNSAPTTEEWLKFLAGCFARRLDRAIFITTGRLTSEQRREAGEAGVVVIEGQEEITRIASLYGIEAFELFDASSEA